MFSLHGYGVACLLIQFAQPDQRSAASAVTRGQRRGGVVEIYEEEIN